MLTLNHLTSHLDPLTYSTLSFLDAQQPTPNHASRVQMDRQLYTLYRRPQEAGGYAAHCQTRLALLHYSDELPPSPPNEQTLAQHLFHNNLPSW